MILYFYIFSFVFALVSIGYMAIRMIRLRKYSSIIYSQNNFVVTRISSANDVLEKVDRTLFYVGRFNQNTSFKILSALVLFLLIYMISSLFEADISNSTLGIIGIFLILLFILAPSYIYKFIVEQRIASIGADIPIFVDLLAVCVQSGMSIEASIRFLSGSVANINQYFAPFLNKLIARIEVSGLDIALADLQAELPDRSISMMCQTLRQSLRYGSKVYDSLMDLSADIRESSLLQTEEAIGKLSAKMSIPLILFFMFPVIIVIAAPGVMRVLGGFL